MTCPLSAPWSLKYCMYATYSIFATGYFPLLICCSANCGNGLSLVLCEESDQKLQISSSKSKTTYISEVGTEKKLLFLIVWVFFDASTYTWLKFCRSSKRCCQRFQVEHTNEWWRSLTRTSVSPAFCSVLATLDLTPSGLWCSSSCLCHLSIKWWDVWMARQVMPVLL